MELRHFRYFLAVAEELSFTRAALRLGIAQPPLSQQIRQLEAEVGNLLFQRLARGVALTDAGQRLLLDARDVLERASLSLINARRAAAGELGSLRVGFTGSASFHPFVTGTIRSYRSVYPEVQVELVEAYTANLLQDLRLGRIDAAFIRPAAGETSDLTVLPLFQEEMLVAMPADHRLSRQKRVALAALREEAFILYPRSNGRALYDAIVGACREAGFHPTVGQSAPQMTSTINLVATGIGISIVPASMAQLLTQGVIYKRIQGVGPKADMVLATQAPEQLQSAKNFTDLVQRRLGMTEIDIQDAKPTLRAAARQRRP